MIPKTWFERFQESYTVSQCLGSLSAAPWSGMPIWDLTSRASSKELEAYEGALTSTINVWAWAKNPVRKVECQNGDFIKRLLLHNEPLGRPPKDPFLFISLRRILRLCATMKDLQASFHIRFSLGFAPYFSISPFFCRCVKQRVFGVISSWVNPSRYSPAWPFSPLIPTSSSFSLLSRLLLLVQKSQNLGYEEYHWIFSRY